MTKEELLKMKISRIEKEIRDTPYNKSSEHHHGVLKAKLAKLLDELEGTPRRTGGGGGGYAPKHSGDASVVLVGFPSVGKSSLLNRATNADSRVADYDFTTLGVIPGMMKYKGIHIQIFDLPGIIEGAAQGKGFGKKVFSVIRSADLIVVVTDVHRINFLHKIRQELEEGGIRPNQDQPKIQISRTSRGGIQVIDPFKDLGLSTMIDVAKEMGINNAVIQINEKVDNVDRLIDGLSRSRKFLPVVEVVNKIDQKPKLKRQSGIIYISAKNNIGMAEFKEAVWRGLGRVRVYLKQERGREADKREPLIMKQDQTLDAVLKKISNEMRRDVNRALIWGKQAKFPGQEVSLSFRIFDEMEIWFGR
jgi:ribosome-interacting GTPase 1